MTPPTTTGPTWHARGSDLVWIDGSTRAGIRLVKLGEEAFGSNASSGLPITIARKHWVDAASQALLRHVVCRDGDRCDYHRQTDDD
ncbi:MAG: hypothetical protein NUW22_08290, partial [Acidobacteria bacterium]|nr:hypothetical protein [Acidobacteriota bacterium]